MTELNNVSLNTKPKPAVQPVGEQQLKEDHDTVFNLWNKENFLRAEFTNDERTHVRVFYDVDGKEEEIDFVYDENHKYTQKLLTLTDLDTMHEKTYKRIKQEERFFKEFAVRVGKEQGLLIDPIAYYDSETQSSKVDTKFYSYGLKLFFEDFDEKSQKEDLFIVKLAAFELDLVKNCEDRDIKSKLRKAKNPVEILHILLDIKNQSS
mgnify:CR=1 FL=1|tara:strand:- start:856 stop:1476 length:621 start_codon:yes stop_codon:yes gene_type:complete